MRVFLLNEGECETKAAPFRDQFMDQLIIAQEITLIFLESKGLNCINYKCYNSDEVGYTRQG